MIIRIASSHISLVAELEHILFQHCWNYVQICEHFNAGNPIWADFDESGNILGYLIASVVAGEWEIYRIATRKEVRRQGIGSRLLQELSSQCAINERVFLEVRDDNLTALELYRANGFEECGRRKRYYEDGVDAVLMIKRF